VTASPLTLRALGPALPAARPGDTFRAALGAMLGLTVAQVVLWLAGRALGLTAADVLSHPMLMAPLGASAVLIFAVPASPLAQPWSVVAGNTLAAAVGLGVLSLGLPAMVTLVVAAFGALVVMALARCLHPPSGAVAVSTVLAAPLGLQAGLTWMLLTVWLGSVLLVSFGLAWHRALGRHYPFSPAPIPPPAPPIEHHAPSPLVLAKALGQLRLEGTLGVDDLSRLIETAEALAPHHDLTASEIMSPDPVTIGPDADWRQMAALFVELGSRYLPVVDGLNRFLGLVRMQAILRPGAQGLTARHLVEDGLVTTTPGAELHDLLPALADGDQTCLPVLEADGSLCGIITRTDIVAALVHATPHPHPHHHHGTPHVAA
jgi:CBS domain-containing membrane protein